MEIDLTSDIIPENRTKAGYLKTDDYSTILNKYGFEYTIEGHFLHVGSVTSTQGWILHISVIKFHMHSLLELVLPLLFDKGTSFKIVKDLKRLRYVLDGHLGYTQIGKVISIYPEDDKDALALAKQIIVLTQNFRGPVIPSDIQLGSVLFTRYGSFTNCGVGEKGGRYIKLGNNELIPDNYIIPFTVPEFTSWPFSEITSPCTPSVQKLLNDRYKIISVLKPDAKGRVMKALYFKGFFKIKPCIIKEGKKHMWADDSGRAIQDRLIWQRDLYNELSDAIPLPKVFNLFKENGDTYLAIEFINGKPLDTIINSIYKASSWIHLSLADHLLLLKYLLKIISVISEFHKKGYVHRDITPSNVLVNRKDNVYFIDIELAYSIANKKPNPPFELGTAGFMSPEQQNVQTPTVKEDIYGLGGLMIVLFTNLPPTKFDIGSVTSLYESLYFLTQSEYLASIITQCLKPNPDERPVLETIQNGLKQYSKNLASNIPSQKRELKKNTSNFDRINNLIYSSLNGLTSSIMLGPTELWGSQPVEKDDRIIINQVERTYYFGLHTGITGVLLMLSKAKRANFNINSCIQAYHTNWKHIEKAFLDGSVSLSSGLYEGTAGIAFAIQSGLKSELLSPVDKYINLIEKCFLHKSEGLDIATGISGQGIALCHCSNWLDKRFVNVTLQAYIDQIIEQQKNNGSWDLAINSNEKNKTYLGFANGVSGIVYFLLTYLSNFGENKTIINSVQKALAWLIKQSSKKRGKYKWGIATKSRAVDLWNFSYGTPGIILTFIKAYDYLQHPRYKEIAEEALINLASTPVIPDFTQSYGLAGLGEVYLEAYKVFRNEEWKVRTNWITELFLNTFLTNEKCQGFWLVNEADKPTADLFVGTSGIIHYLIRYLSPENITYILADT